MPDHPDREQLAAYQAGDGDRRQQSEVEAHLDRCPACAQVVALLEQARRRLALLEEPELPTGLHDRLAAAVADAARADQVVARPAPWYRRPVAWGAAAAVLLAALIVPLLDRTGAVNTTAGGAGGGSAQEAAQAAGGPTASLPLIRVPGEVSAAVVRSQLARDSQAKQALDAAEAGTLTGGGQAGAPSGGQAGAPSTGGQAGAPPAAQGQDTYRTDGGAPAQPAPDQGKGVQSSRPAQADTALLQACLPTATAAADPAIQPLAPAFFVEGTYKGRPATVLVTSSTSQPGRVDLWVFPRADCSAPPLATERVR